MSSTFPNYSEQRKSSKHSVPEAFTNVMTWQRIFQIIVKCSIVFTSLTERLLGWRSKYHPSQMARVSYNLPYLLREWVRAPDWPPSGCVEGVNIPVAFSQAEMVNPLGTNALLFPLNFGRRKSALVRRREIW